MPARFYSLDAIRGLAALSIVFWHWNHFFYNGTVAGNYEKEFQPFYSLLFVCYTKGAIAVDLFFSLSGFIFFWLYSERICSRQISARSFFYFAFFTALSFALINIDIYPHGAAVLLSSHGAIYGLFLQ